MKHLSMVPHSCSRPRQLRRGGFTLVEILVAVAIMALLLAIILVPLRLGFETYHIGTARAGLQQEMQLTMQQMNRDFQRADFVFPNTRIPGISSDPASTTSSCSLQPYPNYPPANLNDPTWNYLPYFRSTTASTPNLNVLTAGVGVTNPPKTLKAISNLSRIDMLFLRRSKQGIAASTGEDYVVSYYPRRLNPDAAYDVIDNPIVLFRAQYPYRRRETDGSNQKFAPQPAANFSGPPFTYNARTDWTQYPALGATANDNRTNRSYLWISHSYYGEANLEPLCIDASDVPSFIPGNTIVEDVIGSHTLATPRGMQLVAPSALSTQAGAFIPELSFVETSSNGNRIDRVTVNMTLAQYDQAGAAAVNGQGKAQRVPVTQTFDLPNATCSN